MEYPSPTSWSHLKKFSFIFCMVMIIFIMLPFPFSLIPVDYIYIIFDKPWEIMLPWAAKVFFGIEQLNLESGGSGDATLHYVQLFLWFIFSLVIAILFTIGMKKRRNFDKTYEWFVLVVRFFLATTLIQYGLAKVLINQFPFPSYRALEQPLSEFSPMGLAWTFMGYSPAYSIFTGSLEVISGLLFLSQRTTLLAACSSFAVMLNVVAMNFCFDIPVKLFSSQLLLLSLFVAAPDIKRIISFFILNRAVEARPIFSLVKSMKGKYLLIGVYLFFFTGSGYNFYLNYQYAEEYHQNNTSPDPLKGIYVIKQLVKNHDTIPLLSDDSMQWKKIIIEKPGFAHITTMSDKTFPFEMNHDSLELRRITLRSFTDSTIKYSFFCSLKGDELTLEGSLRCDTICIVARKKNISASPLLSRGFNWINEYPNNR